MSVSPHEFQKRTAPYVAFASFKSFLANLRESGGAPIVIDNSVYGNMSGSLRSQLKGALRYFGLIDDANRPTDRMTLALATVGDPEAWKGFVRELLVEFYAPIMAHPLTNTTPGELKKEFSANYGGSTEVMEKAITFFTYAAKECGVTLSPRLTERQKPQRRSAGARRKAESGNGSAPAEAQHRDPKPNGANGSEIAEIKDVTAEAMTRILRSKPPKKVQDAVLTIILYLTMGEDAFEDGGGAS